MAVAWVPDLRCSWQFLLQCVGPRYHHLMRTLPPSQSAECARCHDDGTMRVMDGPMEGLTGSGEDKMVVHQLASLPNAIGGLGFRVPNGPGSTLSNVGFCIAYEASQLAGLDRQGFIGRPSWVDRRGSSTPTKNPHGAGRMGSWGRPQFLPSLIPPTRLT